MALEWSQLVKWQKNIFCAKLPFFLDPITIGGHLLLTAPSVCHPAIIGVCQNVV